MASKMSDLFPGSTTAQVSDIKGKQTNW